MVVTILTKSNGDLSLRKQWRRLWMWVFRLPVRSLTHIVYSDTGRVAIFAVDSRRRSILSCWRPNGRRAIEPKPSHDRVGSWGYTCYEIPCSTICHLDDLTASTWSTYLSTTWAIPRSCTWFTKIHSVQQQFKVCLVSGLDTPGQTSQVNNLKGKKYRVERREAKITCSKSSQRVIFKWV